MERALKTFAANALRLRTLYNDVQHDRYQRNDCADEQNAGYHACHRKMPEAQAKRRIHVIFISAQRWQNAQNCAQSVQYAAQIVGRNCHKIFRKCCIQLLSVASFEQGLELQPALS